MFYLRPKYIETMNSTLLTQRKRKKQNRIAGFAAKVQFALQNGKLNRDLGTEFKTTDCFQFKEDTFQDTRLNVLEL